MDPRVPKEQQSSSTPINQEESILSKTSIASFGVIPNPDGCPGVDFIEEANALLKEFSDLKYIQDHSPIAEGSTAKKASFRIVTLESQNLDIQISKKGLTVVPTGGTYETLDNLLVQYSVGYKKRFDEVLKERMQAIEELWV